MALTKTEFTERVLIVLNEDGSFRGAHKEGLSILRADGVVVNVMQGSPEPLQAGDLEALLPSLADLIAALDAANQALETASNDANKFEAENATLVAANESLSAGLADAESRADAERGAKQAALASLEIANARIVELEAKLSPVDANGFAILSDTQARLGLLSAGVTEDQVQAVIAAIPDAVQRESARIYWDRSLTVQRSHPLVVALAGSLGFSEMQLDQLWAYAATL